MFHDPNNHACIRPEFWLDRSLEILDRMAHTLALAPGVEETARLMLCGLESREIPPPTLDYAQHKIIKNNCIVCIRWINSKGGCLTVAVMGKGRFYYRLTGHGEDTGRLLVTEDHINAFRWCVRQLFPAINAVKVGDRKSWWI